MPELNLDLSDVLTHTVKIGIDIYPPIEIASERTRLAMFFEEASSRWPNLYNRVESSHEGFGISTTLHQDRSVGAGKVTIPTFAMTQRGPVFIFPLALPPPFGATAFESEYLRIASEVRKLFLASVVDRQCLRIGLVREVGFRTGATNCNELLTAQTSFAGAELKGGTVVLVYQDGRCNVRVILEPAELARAVRLPVGTTVTEPEGFGLQVTVDVNNSEIRTLTEDEMEQVIERAQSLWPDQILGFINEA